MAEIACRFICPQLCSNGQAGVLNEIQLPLCSRHVFFLHCQMEHLTAVGCSLETLHWVDWWNAMLSFKCCAGTQYRLRML